MHSLLGRQTPPSSQATPGLQAPKYDERMIGRGLARSGVRNADELKRGRIQWNGAGELEYMRLPALSDGRLRPRVVHTSLRLDKLRVEHLPSIPPHGTAASVDYGLLRVDNTTMRL